MLAGCDLYGKPLAHARVDAQDLHDTVLAQHIITVLEYLDRDLPHALLWRHTLQGGGYLYSISGMAVVAGGVGGREGWEWKESEFCTHTAQSTVGHLLLIVGGP